jgi:hypothetical protein
MERAVDKQEGGSGHRGGLMLAGLAGWTLTIRLIPAMLAVRSV